MRMHRRHAHMGYGDEPSSSQPATWLEGCCYKAGCKAIQSLGLPAPFAHDGAVLIDKPSFPRHAAGKPHEVWQGLHASPRYAPSKGAELRTYHRGFARSGPVPEPYFQLPISDRCMRRLYRFRLGAYALPIEMGRGLRMARVARVCPLCPGVHVGDERYYVHECPAFDFFDFD